MTANGITGESRSIHQQHGCQYAMKQLHNDGALAAGWTVEEATDIFFALLMIPVWENLTMERGWSQARYVERMKTVAKNSLVKAG